MKKLSALLLTMALFLGCFGFGLQAQAKGAREPYRVVSTYYGKGQQGFHWYTDEKSESKVIIGNKTYTGSSKEHQGRWAHRVVVSGLAAGKEYSYAIGGYTGKFKTDPGRGKPVGFIVAGDSQAKDKAGFVYSANTMKAAWERFPNADFYAILGDLVETSSNTQWNQYFDAFKGVNQKAAFVPVAGNHDATRDWFRNMFALKEQDNTTNKTGVYYSFDYGDARIAVLNTNDMYPMSVQQRNWLVNDMSKTNAKWKIVLLHKGPYSAGNNASFPDALLLRRALIPIFDELGVDLVLSGHDHMYYRSVPMKGDKPNKNGTVYILPGAVCPKRYDLNANVLPIIKNNAAKMAQPGKPMFTNIAIDGGKLRFQAYTYDPATGKSKLYDSLELTKTKFAKPVPQNRATGTVETFLLQIWNLVTELFYVIVFDYLFTLLPQLIRQPGSITIRGLDYFFPSA